MESIGELLSRPNVVREVFFSKAVVRAIAPAAPMSLQSRCNVVREAFVSKAVARAVVPASLMLLYWRYTFVIVLFTCGIYSDYGFSWVLNGQQGRMDRDKN